MRLLMSVIIVALSLSACTEPSTGRGGPRPRIDQPLTDVYVSPRRLTSRSTVALEGAAQWDGTRWWAVVDGRARQYDALGQLIDDGGVRLSSSGYPAQLAAIRTTVLAAWVDLEPDAGLQLRAATVSAAGGLGTIITIPSATTYSFLFASSASDARLVWSRSFSDGGAETWEATLDSTATLTQAPTKWPGDVNAGALIFDGVRYLALVSPPVTGLTSVELWGLSGPGGEARFTRPLSLLLQPGSELGLGGDARLALAYGRFSAFQLIVDGGVTTGELPSPFSFSSYGLGSVFRDGDHLVTTFGSVQSFVGIQRATVWSDGGSVPISDLQPAVSTEFNLQYFPTPPGVREGSVLQPWYFNNNGGRTGWLSLLALDGGAEPTTTSRVRVLPTPTVSSLPTLAAMGDRVIVGWGGELDNAGEPYFFAAHAADTGALYPTPLIVGTSSWPPVNFMQYEGPVVAASTTEAMQAWSSIFSLRARVLDADGGLTSPLQIFSAPGSFRTAAISFGANGYLLVGVGFAANKVYRFDRAGVLQNPGGTNLPLPPMNAASLGFDGTHFHLVGPALDQSVIWLILDPDTTLRGSRTLAATGSGQVVSGNGYGLAVLSTPAQGNTVLRLWADGGTTTVGQLGPYDGLAFSKRFALLSTATDDAVVAIADAPGVQWAQLSSDGGITLTSVTVTPAPTELALTALASGQLVLARNEPTLSSAIHVDFLTNGADGVVCAGPFDCANLGCSSGLCCTPPCLAPDAGVDAGQADAGDPDPDAGTADAGPQDAGVGADAGVVADAGAAADAGAVADAGAMADAGALDGGTFDAGASDSGQNADGGVTDLDGGDLDGRRITQVGCSCGATDAGLAWLALSFGLVARRRRRRTGPGRA